MSGRSEAVAYLGLGGNLGDPADAMARALRTLDAADGTSVSKVSGLYRTPPWGRTDQPDFLNAVAEIHTVLTARDLLARCIEIERGLKRVRRERWGPRSIDIDILIFGDDVINEDGLQIPHPRMAERAFVLVPLAELAPGLDFDGVSVAERLESIDSSGIHRVSTDTEWWRK